MSEKPRLFDTPFDHLEPKEEYRIKTEAMRVVGSRPTVVEPVAVRSVGVIGDHPSYDPTLFLVPADDYPWSVAEMGALSTQIINQVPGVGRVMVDITPLAKRESGSS